MSDNERGFARIFAEFYDVYVHLDEFRTGADRVYGMLIRKRWNFDPSHKLAHWNGTCRLNYDRLAAECNMSPTTLRGHIRTLQKFGLVEVELETIREEGLVKHVFRPKDPLTREEVDLDADDELQPVRLALRAALAAKEQRIEVAMKRNEAAKGRMQRSRERRKGTEDGQPTSM